MRGILSFVFVIAAIFSACVFVPEEPAPPSGRFEDRLNLSQMVSGWTANVNFSFGNYLELFADSEDFFIDINGQSYSRVRFIQRINLINADITISSEWTAEQSDGLVSITAPTTLNIRRFSISSENFGERTGDVRITVNRNDMSGGWQITEWRELGDDFSIFHPVFGN